MGYIIHGVKADGTSQAAALNDNGELKIAGTFQVDPPEGGATEDKQDAAIAVLEDLATEATLEAARALLAGFLAVGGSDLLPTSTMTRPADTTPYAAGDGVTTATSSPAAMTVTNCARVNGGSGRITGLRAIKSTTTTTAATFRLWIWRVAPEIPNDNAAYSPTGRANNADLVGTATVDFSTGAITLADGLMVNGALSRSTMGFKCADASRDLVIVWQATGAYTPGSAEVFAVALDIAQN